MTRNPHQHTWCSSSFYPKRVLQWPRPPPCPVEHVSRLSRDDCMDWIPSSWSQVCLEELDWTLEHHVVKKSPKISSQMTLSIRLCLYITTVSCQALGTRKGGLTNRLIWRLKMIEGALQGQCNTLCRKFVFCGYLVDGLPAYIQFRWFIKQQDCLPCGSIEYNTVIVKESSCNMWRLDFWALHIQSPS